ncbi:hypothetical protein FOA52_002737 [Chlamydomonas sp. UWO 241]|nr:hypothetical protein FOA52_002737 [Chlamydomonas sp. UWO 241]
MAKLVCAAAKPEGFAKPGDARVKVKKEPKPKDTDGKSGVPFAWTGTAEFKDGWRGVGTLSEMFVAKPTKAAVVNETQLCVYQWNGRVYASAANSTAFQYPLIDAKLMEVDGRPVAETPLDGTQYDLETGAVVVWCPGGSLVRSLLGGMKKDTPAVPLKVYPVRVVDGQVYVKVYNVM